MSVTEGERHLCEYKFGMSGGFTTKLFDTIFHADVFNQARLAQGFPEEVKAAKRFMEESGYWDDLQKRYKER